MVENSSLSKFRRKHKCKDCLYNSKILNCFIKQSCPLERVKEKKKENRRCQMDETGTCPYANESGTCFGFCLKKLLGDKNS